MTDQRLFLEQIIKALCHAGIPYMISGSIGSSFHGLPRATNDADIVIDPTPNQITSFVKSLGPEYYVSEQAAAEAVENRSMFNVIHMQSGCKADLIICKKRSFSREEFARRIPVHFLGIKACILTPEDSILSKLEWNKGRRSENQWKDALGVLKIQKDNLDFNYLKKWAAELGINDVLDRLIGESEK